MARNLLRSVVLAVDRQGDETVDAQGSLITQRACYSEYP